MERRALLLTLLALAGCDGSLDGPARPGPRDAGPPIDAPFTGTCGETGRVIVFFEERCASSGCHNAGGRFPELTRNGLPRLTATMSETEPSLPLLVAGDPDGSFLYRKLAGEQGPGNGAIMPLGTATPIPEATLIRAWIAAGASVDCDDLPPPRAIDDPNALDQGALFTCASPTVDASPARLRRVERREWTHAVVKPLSGTWWGSTARDNPLSAPEGLAYSTYTRDVSVDPATLDLYMLVLPEAPAIWTARDPQGAPGFIPGVRTAAVYDDPTLRCMFEDAAPDAACIDNYVDTLLREGVLFRSPTEGEHARLRALLVATIAEEAGDASLRRASLLHVGQAAFLMAGALFRSEIGEPVEADPAMRRRLTLDELALAIGFTLSTHPVGAPVPVSTTELPPEDPDSLDPAGGRLGMIRAAADDGTLYDPAVIRGILSTYRGGIDASRHDLHLEEDTRDVPARGEYWLAERIQDFFREWLDYESSLSAFKDAPGATGRWDGEYTGDPMWDPTTLAYGNLQESYYGYETTLVDQLDDTIARTVIESHENGDDVFTALLTERTWLLPSNLAETNGAACDDTSDCTESGYESCTGIGLCGNSVSGSTVYMTRVYDRTTNVPATDAGRWVEMPADARMGVLTHPAWLTAHGGNFEDDASAVRRGHWIRENLFCQTVPGLENVMVEAQLVPSAPELSARARIAVSIEDEAMNPLSPTCMGCHGLMNSLGMPFEIYNHAGFTRVWDHGAGGAHGPVIGTSTVTNAPDPALNGDYESAIDLSERIAASPYARRCFLRQVFRFFMGRDEVAADACTLTAMEDALAESGSFFDVLEALILSDAFQYRTIEGGAP